MDYLLTEEQVMIKELCQKIAEEKIRPAAAQLDQKEEFPRDIIHILALSDLFAIFTIFANCETSGHSYY